MSDDIERNPSDLRIKKADKDRDNMRWLPVDMAAELLRDIQSGRTNPTRMLVLYWDEHGEKIRTGEYRAQLTRAQEVAMLELHKAKMMDEWRGR